ncbi:hypothetical protein OROHE_002925 [Orobanche hederae]
MLDTVPDDAEYDTNGSFIDDVELDDYFQVDNSAIKHHGFFVNRGKLELITYHICKPAAKKESDDGHNAKKIAKLGNKGRKASSLIQSNSTTQSHRVVMPNIHGANMQFQTAPANAAEVSIKKKIADPNVKEDSSGLLNGVRQRPEVPSSNNHSSTGEHSEPQTNSTHRSNGKSLHASKAHSERQLDNVDDLDQLIQQNEKGGIVAGFDLNVPASRDSIPTMAALTPGRVGSNVRPKSTSLEKAIIELEKIVAESRPPSAEVQDPDNPSPTVKRRLPSAIKQKLAKVARLAQGSYGKIPMDVISRLMSIVSHLMQINTLKSGVDKEKDIAFFLALVLGSGNHSIMFQELPHTDANINTSSRDVVFSELLYLLLGTGFRLLKCEWKVLLAAFLLCLIEVLLAAFVLCLIEVFSASSVCT